MTVDFSHLSELAVTEETTAEYTFDRIKGDPSVILAPADDTNAPFQRARIEMSLEQAKAVTAAPRQKRAELTVEQVLQNDAEERENNRILIANHCAKAWGTPPLDSKGKEVPFSADNAYQFFKQMPKEMFDPLARFASNLYNFYPDPPLTERDGEALGNS